MVGGRPDGPPVTAAVQAAGASLLDWAELPGAAGGRLEFDEVPFGHPLWVLYSSGTTGLPKAIMHGHGGVVLEHLKALCAAPGPRAGLGVLLVHHHRLDDVELPGRRAAGRRDRGALRRQRDLPGHRRAVAAGRPDRGDLLRHRRAVPAGLRQGRAVPRPRAGPVRGARHRLDRVAAAARGFRLGLPRGRRGPAARLVLRRHRPVHRVRRAVAAAPGAGRHHRRPLPGRPGRGVRRVRPAGHRRGRRAGHHRADAVDAGRLLERSGPASATTPATSPPIPGCGGTGTGSPCCRTAGA